MISYRIKLMVFLCTVIGIGLLLKGSWGGAIAILCLSILSAFLIRVNDQFSKDMTLGGPAGPHNDAKYCIKYISDSDMEK